MHTDLVSKTKGHRVLGSNCCINIFEIEPVIKLCGDEKNNIIES